ncbi:MAG TPA: glutamine-hydrolyzing GMP synthase [Candidatus Methanomethylophilaceae archaeon]|nr:glutamine-hydrolyzing GMP synthase [Candidatus Methanomethylophilaceae archaeon]
MFDPNKFITDASASIKEKVKGKAIIACSGGIDSSVSAVLAGKVLGKDLLAIFVDTGFMRKNEPNEVKEMFKDTGINFKSVDASEEYFEALKGITDPEKKRKVIGEKFIRIFEREAKEFGAKYLIQGTIATDWMESGDGNHKTIKSHHNVGGLPKDMDMTLVEPLWDLYKDQVRQVARSLDIKSSERQAFPGPGLAVRCLADITPENIAIVREACFIVEDEIKKAADNGEMKLPWQYFAVLLSTRTVGIHDSSRSYGKTIAIRAVESSDGMTASHSPIPPSVLNVISKRITNVMGKDVSRVVYDITDKPPATIEWE